MSVMTELAIVVLAGFVGYAVISKVPNTLHTPLMSGTNAIHGIVLLGGLLLMHDARGVLEHVLLVIAIAFGTINISAGSSSPTGCWAMFKAKPGNPAEGDSIDESAKADSAPGESAEGPRSVSAGTIFLQSTNFIDALYIVAFSMFIYGMSGLTGPRTAVRGNLIAAAGMAIAFVATLLTPHVLSGSGTVLLIVLGLVIGTAVGIPAALRVHMTAMPQMVALFNGVGGGAVALIAWVEYRHHFFVGPASVGAEDRDPDAVCRDRRIDLVLGVEHRVRQAAGDPARPADQAAGPVDHQRPAVCRSASCRRSCWPRARIPRRCSSSGSWSPRGCWATWSCCRSAAPTCRW